MKFTESMLNAYSQPLSATEEEQCRNAIRMVADALKTFGFPMIMRYCSRCILILFRTLCKCSFNRSRRIKLFVQGSYANNTNVRTKSDVDVAVIQEEVFRTEYRASGTVYPQSNADYGFTTVSVGARTFKDEVQEVLKEKFGSDVERKNKSIKVHGNTYRKDADVVPWPPIS